MFFLQILRNDQYTSRTEIERPAEPQATQADLKEAG
jgi:hypothetical protein